MDPQSIDGKPHKDDSSSLRASGSCEFIEQGAALGPGRIGCGDGGKNVCDQTEIIGTRRQ